MSLSARWATGLQYAAVVLLSVHGLEAVLMFRHVRLYRGSLGTSIVLTLLFGLLHWKPLADAAKQQRA